MCFSLLVDALLFMFLVCSIMENICSYCFASYGGVNMWFLKIDYLVSMVLSIGGVL